MSDQTPQPQEASRLPDPETAYNHLFDRVHGQVFFGKLAEAGFAPKTEGEAQDLMKLAGKLRTVQQDPTAQEKAAAASPLSQACGAIDGVLSDKGLDGQLKQAEAQEQDVALKQAVQKLAQEPDVYNSVLALKVVEAEKIAKDYGLRPASEQAQAQETAPAPA